MASALFACALSACAADYPATPLPALEGKPLSQAIRYLGRPEEEKKISGRTRYAWINYQSDRFWLPDQGLYPVVIQNHGHPVMAFPSISSPGTEEFYTRSCRLEILANKDLILHAQYQGSRSGCRIFREQLEPLTAPE
ncbi:MAG: hypothetical protein K8R48_06660 [Alphaproteobacteria bacterium]|nr:hypothetical protein [Alphaproteobacteria bacterium]